MCVPDSISVGRAALVTWLYMIHMRGDDLGANLQWYVPRAYSELGASDPDTPQVPVPFSLNLTFNQELWKLQSFENKLGADNSGKAKK